MMNHLSDIYYLAQLIINQISIFVHGIALREPLWTVTTSDDFHQFESKMHRGTLSRHMNADYIVLFAICSILFAFALIAGKEGGKDKNYHQTRKISYETPSMIFYEYGNDYSRESTNGCSLGGLANQQQLHEFGDLVRSQEQTMKQKHSAYYPGLEDFSDAAIFESQKNRSAAQETQSTQTHEFVPRKINYTNKWLFRRTRSGQIYGKYPII